MIAIISPYPAGFRQLAIKFIHPLVRFNQQDPRSRAAASSRNDQGRASADRLRPGFERGASVKGSNGSWRSADADFRPFDGFNMLT